MVKSLDGNITTFEYIGAVLMIILWILGIKIKQIDRSMAINWCERNEIMVFFNLNIWGTNNNFKKFETLAKII